MNGRCGALTRLVKHATLWEGRGGEGRGGEGRGGHVIEHMQRPSAADLRPVSQFMYQTRHVLRNNALGVYAAQQWYVLRST